MSAKRVWLRPAAAFAATAVVFSPALSFPLLHWDDDVNVVTNPFLGFDPFSLLRMAVDSRLGHWHPLTWLSLAVDKALWGLDPGGFHATAVVLHALSAALLFLLARRLLKSDAAAAFAALFWALHPLRVESVAWVTERRDVLSGVFFLACALAHLRSHDEHGEAARRWSRTALALGVAAMLSKVFCILLPGALLFLEAVAGRRPDWKGKRIYLLPCLAVLAANLAAQASSGAAVSFSRFGVVQRLTQAGYGMSFYVTKSFLPVNLSPFYEKSFLLEPTPFISYSVLSVVLCVSVWLMRKRYPRTALAAGAYLFLLLPALGLFKSGRMTAADRWSYLPAIPLSLFAAGALFRAPRAALLAAVVVLGALTISTRAYLPVWSSDRALWERAVTLEPASYYARYRLSAALTAAGDASGGAVVKAAGDAVRVKVFLDAARISRERGDAAAAAAFEARAAESSPTAP